MSSPAGSVVQFVLPFEGLRDRVRNAAEAGNVVITGRGLLAMKRDEVSDIVVIRALKQCELLGKAKRGVSAGEWRCVVTFSAKGFRKGGSVLLTIDKGRVFVEDLYWDRQP